MIVPEIGPTATTGTHETPRQQGRNSGSKKKQEDQNRSEREKAEELELRKSQKKRASTTSQINFYEHSTRIAHRTTLF